MGLISLTIPTTGQLNSVADPAVSNDLTTIETVINGNIDHNNISNSANITLAQLASGVARFKPIAISGGTTNLSEGQFAYAQTSASAAVVLPAASSGAYCGVQAHILQKGATPITVSYSGSGQIYGAGLGSSNYATSFTLGHPLASAILYCPDGVNWHIINGQADTGWISMTLSSGWSTYLAAPAYRVAGSTFMLAGSAIGNGSQTGTVSTTISTPPSSSRPMPSTYYLSSTSTYVASYCQVNSNQLIVGVTGTMGNGDYLYLDGLNCRMLT